MDPRRIRKFYGTTDRVSYDSTDRIGHAGTTETENYYAKLMEDIGRQGCS